ncbi:MAG: hypothetical protein ABSF94_08260 [Steroidobacteraceae bacterium]|jgi:hypothetical protein
MTSETHHKIQSLPTANYTEAMASALKWLGDRYLLAKPINRSMVGSRSDASMHARDGLK